MILRWLLGKSKSLDMKKILVVGLGNIGSDYKNTRHNIGFEVVDYIANKYEVEMTEVKLCKKGVFNFKGKKIFLIKPTTFMNRSGKAVRYWALKENIAIQNILIITDDLNLPLAKLKLRGKEVMEVIMGLKILKVSLIHPSTLGLDLELKMKRKILTKLNLFWENLVLKKALK